MKMHKYEDIKDEILGNKSSLELDKHKKKIRRYKMKNK